MTAFHRFAWGVLALNVAVVGWGAFVRATGSGAGCGRHWPTCNGEIVPRSPAIETAIELTHRATSGLALAAVLALAAWAWRAFPRRHAVRRAAFASLALIVVEALVGAALVLFGWVAKDVSAARGWVMPIHLVITFLLLGALALAADWSARPGGLALAGRGGVAGALALALAALIAVGATGAVAALGDALFPAATLAAGIQQELVPEAHALLRLRIVHPFAAIAAGGILLAVARLALNARRDERVRRAALAVIALVAVQIVAGAVNVLLLAPIWLQLVHLLLADLLWIALVLLTAASLAPGEALARDAPAVPASA